MKTITLGGKKYRLTVRPYDCLIDISGGGIVPAVTLPAGVTLDSPRLREEVAAAVRRHWENRTSASEWIRQRVRDGLI